MSAGEAELELQGADDVTQRGAVPALEGRRVGIRRMVGDEPV